MKARQQIQSDLMLTPPSVIAPVVRIQASQGWASIQLRELWAHRELLYFLAWRDVKVRYQQTLLGAAWAILQPFATMLIFTLIFARLAKMPSDNIPYPIFAYSGLVPWTFFSSALGRSSGSLVGNAELVKKVYFPRLAMPIARVIACLADFVPAFLVLLGMILYFHIIPSMHLLWLPVLLLLAIVPALGVGLWLSALNVEFRDVDYIVPFLVQFWFFATPVAYPSSLLPQRWRMLYGINPMVGMIEGFRWSLLGTHTAPGPLIGISSLVSLVLLVSGALYFRRMERNFADII